MRCYCGQSQPGVWDQYGIVHNGSECRYTDLLITVSGTYKQGDLNGPLHYQEQRYRGYN